MREIYHLRLEQKKSLERDAPCCNSERGSDIGGETMASKFIPESEEKHERSPKIASRINENGGRHRARDDVSFSLDDLSFTTSEEGSSSANSEKGIHSKAFTEKLLYKTSSLEKELEEEERRKNSDCSSRKLDFEESKQQLTKTALLCQQLAERLDSRHDLNQQKVSKSMNQLKHENHQLKQQLKEVIDANVRWQKYDEERDKFVISLQNERQSRRINPCTCSKTGSGGMLTDEQQKEVDKILINAKSKISAVEEEKEKLLDSIRGLRVTVHKKEQEIEQLKRNLAESHQQHLGSTSADDFINILQEQVRTVTEDFEAERRDRERAHSRIVELENQLRQLMQMRSPQNSYYNYQGNTVVDGE